MRVIYVFADNQSEWNSSEWRCAVPARAINRTMLHSAELLSIQEFGENSPDAQKLCADADVIIVQRNLMGLVLSSIQHWKARGKTLIADFDDAYHLMPPSNPAHNYWIKGLIPMNGDNESMTRIDPPPITQFKWGLRLVHGATVPSRILQQDFQNFADIHYLPNYIELDKYSKVTQDNQNEITIGWGGSLSHLESFTDSGVIKGLQRACRARPNVQVLICGADQRIFDQLPIPKGQKILSPWVQYNQWSNILSRFDIGLAPLSGSYDDRRSWIKILEYMVMKIPWIASESCAYNDLKDYGVMVENTSKAWEYAILDMVDKLDDYREFANWEPYLYGISQSIDSNVEKIIETYARISQNSRVPA